MGVRMTLIENLEMVDMHLVPTLAGKFPCICVQAASPIFQVFWHKQYGLYTINYGEFMLRATL